MKDSRQPSERAETAGVQKFKGVHPGHDATESGQFGKTSFGSAMNKIVLKNVWQNDYNGSFAIILC